MPGEEVHAPPAGSAPPPAGAAWLARGGLLVEPRLLASGVPHGVTTRALGGVNTVGGRAAALAAAGLAGRRACLLRQVHGAAVLDAGGGGGACRHGTAGGLPEGDGWVCRSRGAAACVRVADCVPIFVWSRDLAAVGVFHAGWRGLAAGMGREAVKAFASRGFPAPGLLAAVGPHIRPCHYGVKPEVAARFRPEVVLHAAPDGGPSAGAPSGPRLDLGAEARLQLVEAGVPEAAVLVSRLCTYCEADLLSSYRREGRGACMLAFIALP